MSFWTSCMYREDDGYYWDESCFGVRFLLFPASMMPVVLKSLKSLIPSLKSFINNPISQCLDRQLWVWSLRIKLPNLLLLLPYKWASICVHCLFDFKNEKTTLQQNLPMECHYAFTRLLRGIRCCAVNWNLCFSEIGWTTWNECKLNEMCL